MLSGSRGMMPSDTELSTRTLRTPTANTSNVAGTIELSCSSIMMLT